MLVRWYLPGFVHWKERHFFCCGLAAAILRGRRATNNGNWWFFAHQFANRFNRFASCARIGKSGRKTTIIYYTSTIPICLWQNSFVNCFLWKDGSNIKNLHRTPSDESKDFLRLFRQVSSTKKILQEICFLCQDRYVSDYTAILQVIFSLEGTTMIL